MATYRALKTDKEHEYKKGDIIGIPNKYKDFADELITKGIIEALDKENEKAAFDGLRKDK